MPNTFFNCFSKEESGDLLSSCLKNCTNLSYIFFNNHAGVVATKTKSITQCSANQSFLGLIKSKVQFWIQIRIICKVIDSRRNYIVNNTLNTSNGFNNSSSTQAVTCHGFAGTYIQMVSVFAKYLSNCFGRA